MILLAGAHRLFNDHLLNEGHKMKGLLSKSVVS